MKSTRPEILRAGCRPCKVPGATLFALLLAIVLMAGCSQRRDDDGRTVFRYNESSGIQTLDPAFAKDQAHIWVCNQLYNSLVELDSNLHIKPSLARSWDISGDGRTYTFHLRTDVRFHADPFWGEGPGRKLAATDVAWSFNRIIDPAIASPGRWVFNQVSRAGDWLDIRVIDDSTLSISLEEAFPPFLGILSMKYCSVLPWDIGAERGKSFGRNPIGTGPFRYTYWKDGVKLVLLRNDHYFEMQDGLRLPFLDAVSVSFIIEKQSAFLEFIKGKLDFLSGVDASYKDELLTADGSLNPKYNEMLNFSSIPYLNTEYLGFMVDPASKEFNDSPLSDPRVRQAMNYGFDRVKMVRYMRNNAGTAGTSGFIPKGMPTFTDNAPYGYGYDPDKSRRLLAEAGYPDGKGLPVIPLVTTASYLDLCTYIQAELGKIGIPLSIELLQPGALREMISQSKVLFFRGSWIADYPDPENYLSLFYTPNFCPGGPNYTHFSDPQFDRLYEKAMSLTDDSLRLEIYREMDSLLMEQSPVIVLYYDRVSRFTREGVRGLGQNPMNLLDLRKVLINY